MVEEMIVERKRCRVAEKVGHSLIWATRLYGPLAYMGHSLNYS